MDGKVKFIASNQSKEEYMIKFETKSKLIKQANLRLKERLKQAGLELIGKKIKETYETKLENFIDYQSMELEYKWRIN